MSESTRLSPNELAYVLLRNVDERIRVIPKPEHNGGSHERYHSYAETALVGLLALGYAVLDVAAATRQQTEAIEKIPGGMP
ncbi:MAG TPA: hypothetical protein VGG50_11445 [Streptosporangiaceae bacterium]|jgi:hypothetical protein